MKKVYYFIPILAIGIILLFKPQKEQRVIPNKTIDTVPTTEEAVSPTPADFSATFEIYTLGTKRIFSDKKYHNQSSDAYITSENPGFIYVKKEGITWSDFFNTLPMKLEKDCLTTGTGQVFCTNNSRTLRFYINGQNTPEALDLPIKSSDNLKVEYN